MTHPLQHKVETLRRRLRRMLFFYGLNRWLTAVVLAAVVLGSIDYLFRLRDPGLRIICWLAFVGIAGWTAWRTLYLPLSRRLSDVELAHRVERRFGIPADALVSALEFLAQPEDDPLAGSPALRRLVIAEATGRAELLEFTGAINRQPAWRAAMWAAGACLLAGILVLVDPVSSRIAMARLLNPLDGTTWPQRTHLKLRRVVTRVARGQAFEVEVVDALGQPLPGEVTIHYRFARPDGGQTEKSEPMKLIGRVMVARRENVTVPFDYRVTGGDDDSMPWISVEVVEPPRIVKLSALLRPPAYTGLAARRIEPGAGETCMPAGTRVELRAWANKPLSRAWLCLDDGRRMAAALDKGGRVLQVPAGETPLVIESSAACWFELVDSQSLRGATPQRWLLRAVEDQPPAVILQQPGEDLFVTPQAAVPLEVLVKDDLAIQRVELVFQPSSAEQASAGAAAHTAATESNSGRVVLYRGSQEPPEPPVELVRGWTARAGWPGVEKRVKFRWELAELQLVPGSRIEFHVTATDYRPQEGRSQARRLILITPEELQDRLAGRQARLVGLLHRAVEAQRTARREVSSLGIRLAETQRLDTAELDRLQAAALNQRQVQTSLTSPTQGIPAQVRALLADLDNNRLEAPDIRRHMDQLARQLEQLRREQLVPAEQKLTTAVKSAQIALEQPAPTLPAALPDLLGEVRAHQDAVIEALSATLEQLRRWDNYRRFHRAMSRLLRDEQSLAEHTTALGVKTLARSLADLTPQERADLRIAADEQLQLALRLESLQQQMDQAQGELEATDPLAAETISDALAEARRLAISAAMRTCAGQIEANRLARATEIQEQIIEQLREVLDILANRQEQELDRLLRKLREAETELADLHGRQVDLQQRIEQNARRPAGAERKETLRRLGAEQEQLRQQVERLARRLQRLLAERAAAALQRAGRAMEAGSRAAAGGDSPGAARGAREAEEALSEARRQLAARRLQAQAQLAREQLARLQDDITRLRTQQQGALEETQRLEALRREQGRLTRAQAVSLSDLVRWQELLQNDTQRLADDLAGAGAFELVVAEAAGLMGRALDLLRRQQTGDQTQHWQQRAVDRLDMVLAAFQPEQPEQAQGSSQSSGTGPGAPSGEPGGIQLVAELKLVRLLQAEVNQRTRELDQQVARQEGGPTEEQQQEYQELSRRQARLADVVTALLQAQPTPGELPAVVPESEIETPGENPP